MSKASLLIFLLVFLQNGLASLFPHIIWVYWNTGLQNLGDFQRVCFQRVKQLHLQTDWQVRFVQQATIKNFLNETNYQKFQKGFIKKFTFPQARADLLRYYLLKQHGGVWMDITILLKQNLNWLDSLKTNPRVIHKNIFQNPQVFMYIQHQTYRKIGQLQGKDEQMIKIKINGYDYYPLFLIQNAFIAAVKESRFINDLIVRYQKLILLGSILYNQQRQKFQIPYAYSDYFMSFRASSINQYRKYAQYKQIIRSYPKIPKLEDHFYNILIMNKIAGMYHGSRIPQRIQHYMIQQQGIFGDYQPPLMKFSQQQKKFIIAILRDMKVDKVQRHLTIHKNLYLFGLKYIKQQYNCLYQFKIQENSPIHKYFLMSNTQLIHRLYPQTQVFKQSEKPFLCKIGKLNTFQRLYEHFKYLGNILVVTVAVFQFFFLYYVNFFKISKDDLFKMGKLQEASLTRIIFLVALYLQKDLIYSQYQLLMQYSPTAFFVGTMQIICTLLIYVWLVDIDKNTICKKFFLLKLFLIQITQFLFQYFYSVWKYQGQIYNYQDLNYLNTRKLQEGVIQLCNILFVVILIRGILILKKWFNLFYLQKMISEIQRQTGVGLAQIQDLTRFDQSQTSLISSDKQLSD